MPETGYRFEVLEQTEVIWPRGPEGSAVVRHWAKPDEPAEEEE